MIIPFSRDHVASSETSGEPPTSGSSLSLLNVLFHCFYLPCSFFERQHEILPCHTVCFSSRRATAALLSPTRWHYLNPSEPLSCFFFFIFPSCVIFLIVESRIWRNNSCLLFLYILTPTFISCVSFPEVLTQPPPPTVIPDLALYYFHEIPAIINRPGEDYVVL